MRELTQVTKACFTLFALTALQATLLAPAAWAQTYRPPTGNPPSGPHISNGSRTSCQGNYTVPLTALVPTRHVGQTTSSTPTLAWFIPVSTPYRVSLSLYAVAEGGPPELLRQVEYVEQDEQAAGIVSLVLEEGERPLRSAQRYLWEVSIACQPDSPLYDQSFVSELTITPPSIALTTALATAQTPLEKAEIYAGAGYWYDALREALQVSEGHRRDQIVRLLLTDLALLEANTHGESLVEISETLDAEIPDSATQTNTP